MDCIWLILLLACCTGGRRGVCGCCKEEASCAHNRGGGRCNDRVVPMPIFAPQDESACGRTCPDRHARACECECEREAACDLSDRHVCREQEHDCGCKHDHEDCCR